MSEVGDASAQEEVGGFLRVVFQHGDALAGREPERNQPIGHAAATLPGGGKRQPILAVHDCLSIGEERRRASHRAGHVHGFPLLRGRVSRCPGFTAQDTEEGDSAG